MWDVIKFKIKDYAIRYGKTKKKRNTEEKEKLLKYIAKVKNTANFMADDRLRNEFFEAEVKLNSLLDLETQGLITRSRAQWTEQGERSTKYFFGLEKSNSKKKSICKLVKDNVELYEQEEISKHAVDLYRHLFSSKEPNPESMKEYITSTNTPVLDSTLKEELDSEFSIGEIDALYTKLKNNKSPGWDGLTLNS